MESLPPNNSAGTSHSLCNLSDTLIPELKIYLDRHRGSLRQELDNSPETSGIGLSARYPKVVDGLLMSLYEAARAAHGADSVLGLAAVGSYGRNTLTLSSDLDVRVLANGDAQECAKIAEALIYPLWDVGLDVGHQIVTEPQLIELAKSDLPTATTLLDWRYLGSQTQEQKAVLRRVLDAVFDDVGMERFLAQLTTIGVERRHRYGGSIYLLEPDIKNGTGGIRDWDFAHWVARARWRVRDLASLQEMGVLIQREAEDLRQATDFISKLRNQLHGIVNRKVDRLGFEQQEALAKKLGYGDGGSAVEQLMSAYYRNARIVERTMELLIARAAPPPKYRPREQDLGDGTKIVGSSIALVDPDAIFREPSLALRIFDQAARHGFPAQESARIAVMRATSNPEFCEVMRNDKECCRLFTKLLCTKSRTEFKNGSPLSELHDVGILLALIPEFAPVVGRAHHDIYHVYTVDVHSIFAVDFLRARCRGDQANVYPLASRLATEIARPQVLFFAILLHDVCKALGGKNHSERGAVMAESILKRFELAPHDIEQVQHLIQKHLRMYHVAKRRDIDDPQAIADFCAEEITGLEGLREL